MNTTQFHDVPVPAGAVDADDWQSDPTTPYRTLLGELKGIDGIDINTISVQVAAIQLHNGRIDDGTAHETPKVYLGDDGLSPAQARDLAAALLKAADTADRWAAQ